MDIDHYMFIVFQHGCNPSKASHFLTRFAFPCTVVVVRLFRFRHHFSWKHLFFLPLPHSATSWQTVKDTFIDLPMLYRTSCCTVWNNYVRFRPPVFFRITYGTVFVPDLQYALRRRLRTVREDRILKFWIDDWTGNIHAHWFSSRAAVQQSYFQQYFRSRRNTCAAVF